MWYVTVPPPHLQLKWLSYTGHTMPCQTAMCNPADLLKIENIEISICKLYQKSIQCDISSSRLYRLFAGSALKAFAYLCQWLSQVEHISPNVGSNRSLLSQETAGLLVLHISHKALGIPRGEASLTSPVCWTAAVKTLSGIFHFTWISNKRLERNEYNQYNSRLE